MLGRFAQWQCHLRTHGHSIACSYGCQVVVLTSPWPPSRPCAIVRSKDNTKVRLGKGLAGQFYYLNRFTGSLLAHLNAQLAGFN